MSGSSFGVRWLPAAAVLMVLAGCGGAPASSPATAEACSGPSCGSCGDGVVQAARGERCDTGIASGAGACPTSCAPSGQVCSRSVLTGAGTCGAVCAPVPVTACTPGDGCCPAGCTAAAGDSDCAAAGDLAGTWFTRISTLGTITAAAGKDDVTLDAWIRTAITQGGDVTFDVCKLTVTGGKVLAPTYPPALLKTLHASDRLAGGAQVSVGGAVPLPEIRMYGGQTADGTAVDAVPPPHPGGDGDGHPGVTVPVKITLPSALPLVPPTTLSVDVYTGLVVTGSPTGVVLTSATTMRGEMTFASHGIVFGSTSPQLVAAGSAVDVATSTPTVTYSATRLDADGSHDCAYVAGL